MVATVTGVTGAGLTMTAVTFSNVSSFTFDSVSRILSLTDASGHVTQISVSAATTFTWTLVGTVYTIVVS